MPPRKPTITPAIQPDLFDTADGQVARADRKRAAYFAYGSNADQDQMLARCPSARLLGTATLRDHCMVFAGNSPSRGGAVATVFACSGFEVPGALYSITHADLEMLDRFEGVPWMYVRGALWVETDGRKRRANVYWLRNEQVATGIRRPASAYLGLIARAYRRLGIPPDSISLALDIAERVVRPDPTQPKSRRRAATPARTASPAAKPVATKKRPRDGDLGILRARARVRRETFGTFSRLVYELLDGPHAGQAFPVGEEAVEGEEAIVRYRPGAEFARRARARAGKKPTDW